MSDEDDFNEATDELLSEIRKDEAANRANAESLERKVNKLDFQISALHSVGDATVQKYYLKEYQSLTSERDRTDREARESRKRQTS